MKKEYIWIAIIALLVGCTLFFAANPAGRAVWNIWFGAVKRVDAATNYDTRKSVEDTCRAMIASYKADKLRYTQYVGSENGEERAWGEQAKMRANTTAANYNEYVLKNGFVFDGNVPKDIQSELPYIE